MPQTDAIIVAHHVGARGFGVAFNTPAVFDNDIAHVLYEADPACAAAMQAENQRENVFVLPYCLGGCDGDATLYVTANPYASSLLTPSADYAKYYCEVMLSGELDRVDVQGAYYDALYVKENEVVGTEPVRMRSLDSLAVEGALPLGRLPDFLSLDTQGSEHAILSGARGVIGRSVLAIATEIEFDAMYDRQPLFSAILDLANEYGFHFAGFTHLQEVSPHRAPVGQRAKGFVAFGDAIFLRSLETLANVAESSEERYLKALKLAFIAINFGYLEYALQALEYASQCPGSKQFANQLSALSYVRFIGALQRAATEMPRVYLNSTRADLVAQIRSRQQRHPWITMLRGRLRPITDRGRRFTERVPLLRLSLLILLASIKMLYRPIRRCVAGAKCRAGRLRGVAPLVNVESGAELAVRHTPLEMVLGEYGFTGIRAEVRRRRLAALRFAPDR
ncbi:MAG TPA: FkbM family methyltransferase [Stellaceae bacterium]